jgi:hypothetical protein
MAIPTTPAEREQHMALCVGCSMINEGAQNKVACYEHKQRNIDAIKKLIELYNYQPDAPNGNLPMVLVNGDPMVNLHSLVDDIARRFVKGSLVAGETRADS